jgi:outer membrane protein TolC
MGCGLALGVWYSGNRPMPEIIPKTAAARQGGREELSQLLQARYQAAKTLLDLEEKRLREGVTTLTRVCEAARWVRDSAVELPVSAQERLAALTNYVALTRRLEANVDRAAERGAAPPSDREAARYLRLDAEITLLRAQL